MSPAVRWGPRIVVAVVALTTLAGVLWRLTAPDAELRVSGHPGWWVLALAGIGGAGVTVVRTATWAHRRAEQRWRVTMERAIGEATTRTRADAENDRARLLHRLDHELKNPLTALRISLSTAAQRDPVTLGPALDAAVAQTERLDRLLGDLRKLADVRSRPLEWELVDVGALLVEVRDLVTEAHRARAVERQWSVQVPTVPWPLPAIEADAGLLLLAVHNLAENALKYSHPGDRVELRGAEENGGVILEVADTGVGIPQPDQDLVWEELGRSSATAGTVPGSGLGLALVAAIVRRHGGTVELRSRPGAGTAVRLWFPVHRRQP